jgi:hypothetical protein
LNERIFGRHPCCRTPAERRPHLVDSLKPAPLAQWQSSGLLIRQALNVDYVDQIGWFELAGGVNKVSGSHGATRHSAAFVPLVLEIRCSHRFEPFRYRAGPENHERRRRLPARRHAPPGRASAHRGWRLRCRAAVRVEMKLVPLGERRELQDVGCVRFADYNLWPRGS